MNDMTYLASMLGAQRAADVRRDAEILVTRAGRDDEPQPRPAKTVGDGRAAGEASVLPSRRFAGRPHRSARRSTFVAAR